MDGEQDGAQAQGDAVEGKQGESQGAGKPEARQAGQPEGTVAGGNGGVDRFSPRTPHPFEAVGLLEPHPV